MALENTETLLYKNQKNESKGGHLNLEGKFIVKKIKDTCKFQFVLLNHIFHIDRQLLVANAYWSNQVK